MSVLDDPAALAEHDPSDALGAVASLPDQVASWTAPRERAALETMSDRAVVCGMGGSGVAAELFAALAAPGQVVAHHGYGLPAWCDRDTFLVVSSYSGDTEETLDAFRCAALLGSGGVAVASGGALLAEARAAGWVVEPVPSRFMPRFAIGHLVCATRSALGYGDFVPGPPVDLTAVANHLGSRLRDWGPRVAEPSNLAKQLAREMLGSLPVIWGGQGVTGVAASRWRCDLNENAKVPAHSAVLPELDHNEIVGLAAEGVERRPGTPAVVVCLREPSEDPRISRRFEATVAEVGGSNSVFEVTAGGPDPVTRFLDLAMLSGFVSVYLAILRGVDPAPVPSIDRLKRALS